MGVEAGHDPSSTEDGEEKGFLDDSTTSGSPFWEMLRETEDSSVDHGSRLGKRCDGGEGETAGEGAGRIVGDAHNCVSQDVVSQQEFGSLLDENGTLYGEEYPLHTQDFMGGKESCHVDSSKEQTDDAQRKILENREGPTERGYVRNPSPPQGDDGSETTAQPSAKRRKLDIGDT